LFESPEWSKEELNLPVLTLRLVMVGIDEFQLEGSRELTRDQGKEVLAVYNSIPTLLRRLVGPTTSGDGGGFARFDAQLK